MEGIILFPVIHRGFEQILIRFDDGKVINDIVRKIPGVKWSRTYKSWYLLLSESNYMLIWKVLRPLASINVDGLREYLLKKKL